MNSQTFSINNYEMRIRHLCSRELEHWRACSEVQNNWLRIIDFSKNLFELYDQWQNAMLRQRKSPITCHSGCGNCCFHFPQSVETFEMLYLYVHLRQHPEMASFLGECWARVQTFGALWQEHEPQNEDEGDALLQKYFMLQKPCPFLNENKACGVYAHRPLICRMYFSESDPKYCQPSHLLAPENRAFHLYLPDAIEEDLAELSQLMNLGLSESFYEAILELNALEGEGFFDAIQPL